MTFEYECTVYDLVAFNLYHNLNSATGRRQYLRLLYVVPVMVAVAYACSCHFLEMPFNTPVEIVAVLVPMLVFIPVYLAILPGIYRRKIRQLVTSMAREGHNRRLFGIHEVTLTKDGITDSGDYGHSFTRWHAIERVARTDEYAFVYVNTMSAIFIPRRAFAFPEEFEAFVDEARRYHEEAAAS